MAKVMVSLPDEVLARIDREARRRGTTRSGLLREAALRELGRPDPVAVEAAIARSRARFSSSVFLADAVGDPWRVKMVDDSGCRSLTSRFSWCL